jgi:hypothetical protein
MLGCGVIPLQVARVRRRGHSSLLCAAGTRGRHYQINPAEEDYRRWARLALLERDQTRAEGVKWRHPVAAMQTRSRFLTTLSLVGPATLVRTLRTDGVLETTSVRLPKGSMRTRSRGLGRAPAFGSVNASSPRRGAMGELRRFLPFATPWPKESDRPIRAIRGLASGRSG